MVIATVTFKFTKLNRKYVKIGDCLIRKRKFLQPFHFEWNYERNND